MRRSFLAAVTPPVVIFCSLYGANTTTTGPTTPVPRAALRAASAPATPPHYRGCGPDARPETGLQGAVPKADQRSGQSRPGYRCNLRLVGQNTIGARGANMQLAWYEDCAYVGIIGTREFNPASANPAVEGIGVIDASDPAHPEHVQTIISPVGRNQHEGLEVNAKRGMLVAEVGGISARYIEIYDVSEDCRHPVLKATYDSGKNTFHGLKISDDGTTIYATDGIGQGTASKPLHIIDVTDMSNPRLVKTWGPGDEGGEFHLIHDLDLSVDGTRAYLGAAPANTSISGLGATAVSEGNIGPTVVTLDTTDIVEHAPEPDLDVVSTVKTPNFGHTIQRATIGGKPYMIASGESPFATGLNCPWAWGYLIDMSDERAPQVMSQLKLEVNQPQNCAAANADNVTYSIHYVGVDDERNTTKVFYTYYGAGLRVFDVRDPAHPTEIAYYHPPAQPDTVLDPLIGTLGGDAQTPDWDSATSVVRYRPETGQIWVATIGGGLSILELTGEFACVPAATTARGRRFGGAKLGRTRRAQAAALPARGKRDRFCTTDGKTLRIGYARGRAAVIASDSPYASARGIAPGTRVGVLRRRLRGERAVRVGRATWFVARGRIPAVFRVRAGRVREVGVARGPAPKLRRLP
jgi:hypothetical protein